MEQPHRPPIETTLSAAGPANAINEYADFGQVPPDGYLFPESCPEGAASAAAGSIGRSDETAGDHYQYSMEDHRRIFAVAGKTPPPPNDEDAFVYEIADAELIRRATVAQTTWSIIAETSIDGAVANDVPVADDGPFVSERPNDDSGEPDADAGAGAGAGPRDRPITAFEVPHDPRTTVSSLSSSLPRARSATVYATGLDNSSGVHEAARVSDHYAYASAGDSASTGKGEAGGGGGPFALHPFNVERLDAWLAFANRPAAETGFTRATANTLLHASPIGTGAFCFRPSSQGGATVVLCVRVEGKDASLRIDTATNGAVNVKDLASEPISFESMDHALAHFADPDAKPSIAAPLVELAALPAGADSDFDNSGNLSGDSGDAIDL